MKRWLIVICIVVFITICLGQVCKLRFNDCGISSIENYEDINKLNCRVDYIFGNNNEDEEFIYYSFTEYEEDYVNDLDDCDIIIIGESTGKYKIYGHSFYQEVKVNEVIRGNKKEINENDIIDVYNTYGFISENNKPLYNNIKNIMIKGTPYLIFLHTIKLNEYTGEKAYKDQGGYFCFLRLTDDIDYTIVEPLENIRFNDLQDLEFFTSSERILKQIQIIKQKIIDKYCKTSKCY